VNARQDDAPRVAFDLFRGPWAAAGRQCGRRTTRGDVFNRLEIPGRLFISATPAEECLSGNRSACWSKLCSLDGLARCGDQVDSSPLY